MASLELPILIWEDESKNVYGKIMFVYNFPPELNCAVGRSIIQVKKDLQKTAERVCNQLGINKLLDCSDMTIAKETISIKPTHVFEGKSIPETIPIEITMPFTFIRSDDSVGVVEVEFPIVGGSFSCDSKENIRKKAQAYLKNFLADKPVDFLYHLPMPLNVSTDSIRVSTKLKGDRAGENYKRGSNLLNRVASPFNLSTIKSGYIPAWQMQDSVSQLSYALQKDNASVALIGPSGCGKSTVLAAAIKAAEKEYREQSKRNGGAVGASFCENRFWQTNEQRLVLGTKWLGEWQQQVSDAVEELASFDGVLCVENLSRLILDPEQPETSIASYLIPVIRSRRIRVIGEMTPEEHQSLKHVLPEFAALFEPIRLQPLSYTQGVEMLKDMNREFERNHKPYTIDEQMPTITAQLFRRFYGSDAFPGVVSRFWQKTIPLRCRKKEQKYTIENVYDDFITQTGMPQWLFRDDIYLSFDKLKNELSSRIVAQPDACEAAANVIIRFKSAMNNPNRPIGSFLFCGPTGVGKTQMVKTLTRYLFNNQSVKEDSKASASELNKMFRLDMSEYSLPWTARQITESLDGSPSKLIEHVRQHPFSVILFDEIEKADSAVFDVLLNLLDEGRLSDRLGRTTSFKNTIIVMTSNLGSGKKPDSGFIDSSDDASNTQQNRYYKEVERYFRPEFVNRIDQIVVFNKLDRKASEEIVRLELSALKNRLGVKERRLKLYPTENLVAYLVKTGFAPFFGARPLQRAIESKVVVGLAHWITTQTASEGSELVLDWKDDALTIEVKDKK